MKNLLCTAALVVFLASGGAIAQDAAPHFLPPDAIDLAAILPPPPSQNSETTKAEIAEIHRAQSTASDAEKAQAVKDSTEEVFLFATVLGPDFSAAKLPAATTFFREVGETEGEFVNPAKKVFGRPRPPLADRTISPCEKLKGSAAYPSGHSTYAYLQATVLVQMIPEKRDAIFERAAQFAHNRVVCGVHYASDLEAGKISGITIGAMLHNSPTFNAEFEPAKAEVRKVLGLPAR